MPDPAKVAGASSYRDPSSNIPPPPKVAGASSSRSSDSKVGGASSAPPSGLASAKPQEGIPDSPRPKPREQDAPATPGVPAPSHWEYFNPLSEIDIRVSGNLPHWEQGSVWYFVTFRLADALPRAVVEEIQHQRERWRRTHDLGNLSREELAEYHRLFSERYAQLLDAGGGSCVLREPANADIVRDALRHFAGRRYVLDEQVVMPNHVHVLVKPLPGHGLVKILHSWKSFTANQLNRRLGRDGQLWQHESYDHIVRGDHAMDAIRRYIRENPAKVAGASSSRSSDSKVAGASSSPPPSSSTAPGIAPADSPRPQPREQDAPATS